VLLLVVIMFSFGCFVPVKGLAGEIVFKMTYYVSYSTQLQLLVVCIYCKCVCRTYNAERLTDCRCCQELPVTAVKSLLIQDILLIVWWDCTGGTRTCQAGDPCSHRDVQERIPQPCTAALCILRASRCCQGNNEVRNIM